jgi:tetratricopeptide (TPR) repeat protein
MRSILAMVAALLPLPAAAQANERQAAAWCTQAGRGISSDQAIAGCTWFIRSRQSSALVLAIAFRARGIVRAGQGDRAGALADLNEAISINPRDDAAFFNRGIVRRDEGDRAGALADFNEAIRINPRDDGAFFNRGLLRRQQGDHVGALVDVNEAIRIDPRNALAFTGRGVLRHEQDDLRTAIIDYNRAIRIDSRHANALANRCIARQRLGERDAARRDCAAAIDAAGLQNGWPYAARAGLAMLANDLPEATRDLEESIMRDASNPPALQLRALLRGRQGDGAGSAADAAAARASNPRIAEQVVGIFGPAIAAR